MKSVLFAVALAVAGTVACQAQDTEKKRPPISVDGVVAYVNDAVITFSDVMVEVNRMPMDYAPPEQREQRRWEMFNATLNAMVNRRLVLDYAKKTKVQLQPWAVDARIREIVQNNFDGDQTKLYDSLADRKMSIEEWKTLLEEDLLLSAMRYQYVEKRVSVSPSEIRAEYEANKARYQTEGAVAVSMIVLAPPADASEGTITERANMIAAALKDGTSFADLARRYSKDSKAQNGGSWGKINPEDVFFKDLATAVTQLRPGQVTPLVVQSGYGYIARKDEQQDLRVLTFDEAAQFVEGRLKVEKSEKMFKEWVARLRNEAYIKILDVQGGKKPE